MIPSTEMSAEASSGFNRTSRWNCCRLWANIWMNFSLGGRCVFCAPPTCCIVVTLASAGNNATSSSCPLFNVWSYFTDGPLRGIHSTSLYNFFLCVRLLAVVPRAVIRRAIDQAQRFEPAASFTAPDFPPLREEINQWQRRQKCQQEMSFTCSVHWENDEFVDLKWQASSLFTALIYWFIYWFNYFLFIFHLFLFRFIFIICIYFLFLYIFFNCFWFRFFYYYFFFLWFFSFFFISVNFL